MARRLALLVALVAALAVAGCSTTPAVPALTDPNEILTKSVEAMTKAKSAHFIAVVTGNFKADLMGTGQASDINLTGTTLEGDLDVAGKKMRASFAIPALLGLSGELVQIEGTSYVKTSLTGPKYQKSEADTVPEEVTDPTKAVAELSEFLSKPGVDPTKTADIKCGDNKDCYNVDIELTAAEIAALSGETPDLGGTDLSNATIKLSFGVEKDTLRMSRVVLSVNMGAEGSIDLTLDMTKWDEAVTIEPPPADQVSEGGF